LVAHDDYIGLLNQKLCSVQLSISGNNKHLTRAIEPGAPSYERRLRALRKLGEAGFWTTVRINPLFPKFPDGYFTDPQSIKDRFGSRSECPSLPFYDDSFIGELADAKVPSILAGFVRLSPKAINNISKVAGIDLKTFFKPELYEQRGDKRYSDSEIAYYYKMLQKDCLKHNVRFNTCYIGNGIKDFFQYQDLWTNPADCCDAIGNVKAFKGLTSQNIPWTERKRHAPCKANADQSEAMETLATQEFEQKVQLNSINLSGKLHDPEEISTRN
jgi:DNA repair photolyase